MIAGRSLMLSVVVLFALSLAMPGISTGMSHEVRGAVTKIEGSKVTVKDSTGTEKTIEAKSSELMNIKVGDQVEVKDGVLTKAGGAPAAPAPGPKY
jgi:hypothetical protein